MSDRIEIVIDIGAAQAGLDRLASLLDDMTPIMRDIGEYMIKATKERFRKGAGPDGSVWPAKSATTIAAYLARGDRADPRPLIGPSGLLSQLIAAEVTGSGRAVEIGSSRIYAGVMQFGARRGAFGQTRRGAPIPWGDIPARPFLGASEADLVAIGEIVSAGLSEATKG